MDRTNADTAPSINHKFPSVLIRPYQCFTAAANGAVLAASDKIAAFIAADDDAAVAQFSSNYVVPNTRSEGGALKGPSADSDFAAVVLRAHTASRKERKASNMMHLTWDQQLAGQLDNLFFYVVLVVVVVTY